MTEQKYIRVEETQHAICNVNIPDGVFEKAFSAVLGNVCEAMVSLTTYTPADILAGMWVPVTERLPEMGKKVLVFWRANGEPCIDTAFRLWDGWTATHWELSADVTHWMPLPLPPKEE